MRQLTTDFKVWLPVNAAETPKDETEKNDDDEATKTTTTQIFLICHGHIFLFSKENRLVYIAILTPRTNQQLMRSHTRTHHFSAPTTQDCPATGETTGS